VTGDPEASMRRHLLVFGCCLGILLGAAAERPSEQEFTQEVLTILRSEAPGQSFEAVAPLEIEWSRGDGRAARMFLANIYKNSSEDPVERAEAIRSYVRTLLAPSPNVLTPDDRTRVLPVIRDEAFLEETRKLSPLSEPLVSNLLVFYVLDFPDRVQYLLPSHLEELRVARAELRALAVANLARKAAEVKVHTLGPIRVVELDGVYESSLLLLDAFWERVRGEVEGGKLIAAVPARDLLLFTDASQAEAKTALRDAATQFESEAGYPISAALLVRDGAGWQPLP
jgi:uncharacterized protein YtpQ (UPF0354 family)